MALRKPGSQLSAMSPRQKEVYEFIAAQIKAEGVSPTVREIGAHIGVTINAVARHLEMLETKGFITRRPGLARNIRLKDASIRVLADGDGVLLEYGGNTFTLDRKSAQEIAEGIQKILSEPQPREPVEV